MEALIAVASERPPSRALTSRSSRRPPLSNIQRATQPRSGRRQRQRGPAASRKGRQAPPPQGCGHRRRVEQADAFGMPGHADHAPGSRGLNSPGRPVTKLCIAAARLPNREHSPACGGSAGSGFPNCSASIQNCFSLSLRCCGWLPATMAPLIAPMEAPAIRAAAGQRRAALRTPRLDKRRAHFPRQHQDHSLGLCHIRLARSAADGNSHGGQRLPKPATNTASWR